MRLTLSSLLLAFLVACGVSTGVDAGIDTAVSDTPTDADPHCSSDRDCAGSGRLCDPNQGLCVQCLAATDCYAGQICVAHACSTPLACTSSRTCPGQVCNTALGYCVDCVDGSDCPASQMCSRSVCVAAALPCVTPTDCAMNQACDPTSHRCVDCARDVDCPAGFFCNASTCQRQLCTPDAVQCQNASTVSTCVPDGSAWVNNACASGTVCSMGVCSAQICAPGTLSCASARSTQICNAHGLGYTPSPCATGQVCNGGICVARVCAPGSVTCTDTRTVRRCNPDGLGYSSVRCPDLQSCSTGGCTPWVCIPPGGTCLTRATARMCSADGLAYTDTPCTASETCWSGACTPWTCTPGTLTCVSSTETSMCETTGLGAFPISCTSPSTCGSGVCSNWTCTPNATSCASATSISTCDPDGRSSSISDCFVPFNAISASCAAGACTGVCAAGFGDCDGDWGNGCESPLSMQTSNCGACGHQCPPAANAMPACRSGTCGLVCSVGFGDCDHDPTNGCEATLASGANCGACGHACPGEPNSNAICTAGRCGLACATGFADCDGNPANGCETSTDTSPTSCGACGQACAAGSTCMIGSCSLLVSGLGGLAGYGSNRLNLADDYSTSPIDLSIVSATGLRFYAATYPRIFVSNNGVASFAYEYSGLSPGAFPFLNSAILAAWWGDVDTRNGSLADGSRDAVYWDVRAGQFVATWLNVGYYAEHDGLQNTFQLVLRNRGDVAPGNFDVEYRYQRCQWTTGDASGGSGGLGGTPAQVGFNGGDPGGGYLTLPGSMTAAVLMLCTTSNVGVPGIWRYQVRDGIVM